MKVSELTPDKQNIIRAYESLVNNSSRRVSELAEKMLYKRLSEYGILEPIEATEEAPMINPNKLTSLVRKLLKVIKSMALTLGSHPDFKPGSEFEDQYNRAIDLIKKATKE